MASESVTNIILPTARLNDSWYEDAGIDRGQIAIDVLDVTDKSFGSVERVELFKEWMEKYKVDSDTCLSMYCQAIRDGITASSTMLDD